MAARNGTVDALGTLSLVFLVDHRGGESMVAGAAACVDRANGSQGDAQR